MKKTNVLRTILAWACTGTLCLGMTGCGQSAETGSSETAAAAVTQAGEAQTDAAQAAVTAQSEAGSTRGSTEVDEEDLNTDSALITNDDGSVSQNIFAMDTVMVLRAYGDNAAAAVTAGTAEIHRLDQLLSTGISTSEIAKINADGGGSVSEDTEYLIDRSLTLYGETDGAFDIAIYPVMQLWGFPTEQYRVPTESEIEETLKLTDAGKVHLDTTNHEVSFDMDGMEIDLGGIAKGYTSARLMDIFKENGVTSALVSLGGNVQVLGAKTDGSSWRVAVEDPDSDSSYLGILSITDKAVITSGGYERYFEQDGKTYHHIIDPKTGYPADSGIHSSTIISSDGTLADGLSTSLFIMGIDKASDYWRNHQDAFDFVLETDDGVLHVTKGIADSFTSDREVEIVE